MCGMGKRTETKANRENKRKCPKSTAHVGQKSKVRTRQLGARIFEDSRFLGLLEIWIVNKWVRGSEVERLLCGWRLGGQKRKEGFLLVNCIDNTIRICVGRYYNCLANRCCCIGKLVRVVYNHRDWQCEGDCIDNKGLPCEDLYHKCLPIRCCHIGNLGHLGGNRRALGSPLCLESHCLHLGWKYRRVRVEEKGSI
jgi:hypothetical protein